jgi:ERCC4-related helicase
MIRIRQFFQWYFQSWHERLALQEALFLHQFCSSPAEVQNVCSQLERGSYNYAFAKQKELTQFIREHRPLVRKVNNPHHDPKLDCLMQIIKDAGSEKIVIFCEYLETARVEGWAEATYPERKSRNDCGCAGSG